MAKKDMKRPGETNAQAQNRSQNPTANGQNSTPSAKNKSNPNHTY